MLGKLLDKTFWKFMLVGVINTLVGSGCMFLLYNVFHIGYWISSASNYIVGSVTSYILNKHFTFQNKSKDPRIVMRFIINTAVCYLLAYGIAKPVVRTILSGASTTVQENGAMLMGMGVYMILNYLGQRFFAFREEK